MKRLLRISLDTLIASLSSILIWFVLSLTIDKKLINVFTLMFPIQYISSILISIFATGANISKEKGNQDDTMSGIFFGIIFAIVFVILFLLNIDSYLKFMNYSIDKLFVIYSCIQIFLHNILSLILTKLYYEGKNILANKYSVTFYLLNFISILLTSIFLKKSIYVIIITLSLLFIFIIYILIKNCNKFKMNFNIIRWIKYDAITLSDNIFLCLAYLFGLSFTMNYGNEYILALTFIALITDTQWDISGAISTVAKIDISQNNFNYKAQLKSAKKLVFYLIMSILIMFVALFGFYNLNPIVTICFLIFHIIDFMICIHYKIDTYYLQLEYSIGKTTAINLSARFLRLLLSFLKTPYCTVIAQVICAVYQTIFMKILFKKNFRVNKEGFVKLK